MCGAESQQGELLMQQCSAASGGAVGARVRQERPRPREARARRERLQEAVECPWSRACCSSRIISLSCPLTVPHLQRHALTPTIASVMADLLWHPDVKAPLTLPLRCPSSAHLGYKQALELGRNNMQWGPPWTTAESRPGGNWRCSAVMDTMLRRLTSHSSAAEKCACSLGMRTFRREEVAV